MNENEKLEDFKSFCQTYGNGKAESLINDDDDGEEEEQSTLSSSTSKKRKIESSKTEKAEEDFVRVDAYKFLDLHYHQLLYAENGMEQAKKGLKKAKESEEKGICEESLINISHYLERMMQERAWKSKSEIEEALESKPKFRGRVSYEIHKCEKLIEDIIGKKLEWKSPQIAPNYGHSEEDV